MWETKSSCRSRQPPHKSPKRSNNNNLERVEAAPIKIMVVDHTNQWGPIFRTDQMGGVCFTEQNNNNNMTMMMEKRQLFLRSYQFSRKRSVAERIKRNLIRIKRLIWFRLRSARRFRKLVWSRLRSALSYRRRQRFLSLRLLNNNHHHEHHYYNYSSSSTALNCPPSSCFW